MQIKGIYIVSPGNLERVLLVPCYSIRYLNYLNTFTVVQLNHVGDCYVKSVYVGDYYVKLVSLDLMHCQRCSSVLLLIMFFV